MKPKKSTYLGILERVRSCTITIQGSHYVCFCLKLVIVYTVSIINIIMTWPT
jgi:hypothetical protein